MFYICVICDCVCVLKYAIYLIWPRQFSFGPCFFNLAHTLARTKNEPEGTLPLDGCACTFEESVYGGRKVPLSHELAHLYCQLETPRSYKLGGP